MISYWPLCSRRRNSLHKYFPRLIEISFCTALDETRTFPSNSNGRIRSTNHDESGSVQNSQGRCVARLILRCVEKVSSVSLLRISIDDTDKAKRLAKATTCDLSEPQDRFATTKRNVPHVSWQDLLLRYLESCLWTKRRCSQTTDIFTLLVSRK